jgi:hypothetical protein
MSFRFASNGLLVSILPHWSFPQYFPKCFFKKNFQKFFSEFLLLNVSQNTLQMIHTLNCLLPFYALPCLQFSQKDNVS